MGSYYKNGKLYTGRVESELTGSNVQLKEVDATSSGDISIDGSEIVILNASNGFIGVGDCNIRIKIPAPSGATAGDHRLFIYSGSDDEVRELFLIANYNDDISLISTEVYSPSSPSVKQPASDIVIAENIRNLMTPIRIKYENKTDVIQSNNRTIKAKFKESGVV